MSNIELIHGSCADQIVDVVVNAANSGLWAGGGICGVIFDKAGYEELTAACNEYKTPLKDGEAVITPSFKLGNAKAIIHAVGPDFRRTPAGFKELFEAYYNSLMVMKEHGHHSISFPLISSGIFSGRLAHPAKESAKQCCRAYKKFTVDYPEYYVDVKLCAFTGTEYEEALEEFDAQFVCGRDNDKANRGLITMLETDCPEKIKDVTGRIIGTEKYKVFKSILGGFDRGLQLKSDIHGISHVERVCFLGLVLASEMDLSMADTRLLITACAYHDVGRREEWTDAGHGKRAADVVGNYVDYKGQDLEILKAAIEAHDRDDNEMEATIEKYDIEDKDRVLMIAKLLKDSDGLDRVRVSDLDPSRLRYDTSRKYVDFAKELFRFYN